MVVKKVETEGRVIGVLILETEEAAVTEVAVSDWWQRRMAYAFELGRESPLPLAGRGLGEGFRDAGRYPFPSPSPSDFGWGGERARLSPLEGQP